MIAEWVVSGLEWLQIIGVVSVGLAALVAFGEIAVRAWPRAFAWLAPLRTPQALLAALFAACAIVAYVQTHRWAYGRLPGEGLPYRVDSVTGRTEIWTPAHSWRADSAVFPMRPDRLQQ